MFEPSCKQSATSSSCQTCESRIDSIFCNLPEKHLAQLDDAKVTNLYKKHQVLCHEGNVPLGVYCILQGKVKLTRSSAEGKELIVGIYGPGDVIGLREVLLAKEISTTAEVIDPARICFIDKKFFRSLLDDDKDLALQVLVKFAEDSHSLESRLNDLSSKTVKRRLYHLLITLAATYGVKTDRGVFIDLRLTRSEMASMISATPETVIRLLSELESEKLAILEGKDIYLTDLDELSWQSESIE